MTAPGDQRDPRERRHRERAAAGSKRSRRRKKADDASAGLKAGAVWAFLAWVLTILFFLPVAWMVLTSFHREVEAAKNPPALFAPLTGEQYSLLFSRDILP